MRVSSGISVLVSVVLCAALSACSSTIHKQTRIGVYNTLSIDAKQRMVFFGNTPRGRPVVCAEPSPDALVAISAALAAQGSAALPAPTEADKNAQDKFDAGFGVSSSETAASIAMRTATIQVLRDGYYRFCEGLMNGSIPECMYAQIIGGIDPFVTTVMSIDAIGGTQRAPLVAVTGGVVDVSATATGASATVTGAGPVLPPDGSPPPTPPQANVTIGQLTVPVPDANQAIAIRNIMDAYLSYENTVWDHRGGDQCDSIVY
jgi:hypothetical protein